MTEQREQWWCFRCGRLYDRPSYEEAYDERGHPTLLYYCPGCVVSYLNREARSGGEGEGE